MPASPSVDGVVPASAPAAPQPPAGDPSVRKWKMIILGACIALNFLFIVWCLFLMTILPSPDVLSSLVMLGVGSCVIAVVILLGFTAATLPHIMHSKASPRLRQLALIKLIAIIIPGLGFALATPFMIMGEPPLSLDITQPTTTEELVAPVAMTFSAKSAADVLARRGFTPVQYQWDLNGDKKPDQQTLEPTLTATFERQGVFTVSVVMQASDGSKKAAGRRFIIRQSVFSVTPANPIIDQAAIFSLENLYPDAEQVTSVAWDFDGDGNPDEESGNIESSYTYIKTGKMTVSAVVQLANKTQARYERVIDVRMPPELPFPVRIVSQPQNLIGSSPFPALFSIETNELIYNVQWDFGDGQKGEGIRSTHTFSQKGTFSVQAKVRSQSGVIADLSTIVRVIDRLDLPDLRFDGTPEVFGNKISGEVPLTLDLQPSTQKPFVQFTWEAPEATDVGSTNDHLQAIYRRPGRYTVTLIAQDLENHVLRMPITVEVLPPASLITIVMDPETGVAPLTVKFDASETSIPGEDITGFIWNFGDGSDEEFGGSLTEHTYLSAGTYVVNLTVRTTSGEQQNTSRTLVVRAPILQARILASRLSGPAPLTVAFDASPTTGNIASYVWNFGDGTENDGKETEHTFTQPGTYPVQLTVTDVSGKVSTASISISVQ
jgi:PKD repeat protein